MFFLCGCKHGGDLFVAAIIPFESASAVFFCIARTSSTDLVSEIFLLNPFPPSVPIWHRLAKLSISILEGIIKKISYNDEKKNSGGKGLMKSSSANAVRHSCSGR